jgi:chromosome segregation ATPase
MMGHNDHLDHCRIFSGHSCSCLWERLGLNEDKPESRPAPEGEPEYDAALEMVRTYPEMAAQALFEAQTDLARHEAELAELRRRLEEVEQECPHCRARMLHADECLRRAKVAENDAADAWEKQRATESRAAELERRLEEAYREGLDDGRCFPGKMPTALWEGSETRAALAPHGSGRAG